MLLKLLFLLLFPSLLETTSIESEDLDIFALPDYLDMNPRLRKSSDNIREKFLKNKRQRALLQNFDKLVSNNTIRVDGISHLEITSDWKKAHVIEKDYKDLITMKNVKYVYQRDDHWRTWRQVEDSHGSKMIICYKCQSKIHPNCTDCSSRGIWVIEEGMPPCPYELFSLVNSNEICASNYTQLGTELKPCPSIIKFADLTKTCNNPIVTRWRFTEDYRISEREWKSIICEGREYCEIITLYQIRPDYVVFRIVNTTNSEIIYSRVMQINKRNFACINDCGVIDLKTFKVTKIKEKSEDAIILNLLPNKAKRDSVKKTKKHSRKKFYSDITDKVLTTKSLRKTKKKKQSSRRSKNRNMLGKTNITYKWVDTGNGIYISVVEATTKSLCKKIIEKNSKNSEDTYNVASNEDRQKSIAL